MSDKNQTMFRPVAVVLERSTGQVGQWQFPRWQLVDVLEGDVAGRPPGRVELPAENDRQRYLWTGFHVTLYHDALEGYWYNLSGVTPSVFVICRGTDDDESELEPVLVTANHDESAAHLETDDTIFATPLPPGLHTWLERFVVDNYQPEIKKKRQRKAWSEEEVPRETPRARRPIRGN